MDFIFIFVWILYIKDIQAKEVKEIIISFAWTTEAFRARRKTRTRRDWSDRYAQTFIKGIPLGKVHDAYDRQPRFGGRKIGTFRVVAMKREHMSKMPDEDFEREGFKFMEEQDITIWGKGPREAFNDWRNEDTMPWVVDFEILSVEKESQGIESS